MDGKKTIGNSRMGGDTHGVVDKPLCEACGIELNPQDWYPKPRCRYCGWILSCCSPEISYAWKGYPEK